jgi:hypothetical protein
MIYIPSSKRFEPIRISHPASLLISTLPFL